ncbi:MAG TPA: type II secretion system protein [Candidatus Acidoferrum sp.]|nr:type II secretion system protein [Candidatus Acidoferrum sp.]
MAASSVRRQLGFTLIEILVVIVLVTITLSVAALAVPDGKQQHVQQEAQRLLALINHAERMAVIENRNYALHLAVGNESVEYDFLEYDAAGQNWIAATNPAFRARQVAKDITIMVDVAPEETSHPTMKDSSGSAIYLDASGTRSRYQIRVSAKAAPEISTRIVSDGVKNAAFASGA